MAGEALLNPDLTASAIGSTAAGVGQTLYTVLIISLTGAVVLAIVGFVWWWTSFKYQVTIREITGRSGHYLIYNDRAKRKRKDGAEFWKLRRRKAIIPAPPSEAIQITARGRYYAECAHHEKSGVDAGYQWITSNNDDPASGDYKINQTQEERALLADRLRRANDRKSLRTLDVIMQFAGMFFVLVIVVTLLAFFGEISQNVTDAAKETEVVLQRFEKMQDQQIAFQEQLNMLFLSMECELPSVDQDVPLDTQQE